VILPGLEHHVDERVECLHEIIGDIIAPGNRQDSVIGGEFRHFVRYLERLHLLRQGLELNQPLVPEFVIVFEDVELENCEDPETFLLSRSPFFPPLKCRLVEMNRTHPSNPFFFGWHPRQIPYKIQHVLLSHPGLDAHFPPDPFVPAGCPVRVQVPEGLHADLLLPHGLS
jgi:hypothetical protein